MVRRLNRPQRLRGQISPPGDKSITHRAFILNGTATGSAEVRNFSHGGDCHSTLACMRALGVRFEEVEDRLVVHGRGAHGFTEPRDILDAGNSGTTMRLMSGLLASLPFRTTITGDASLRGRPMDRVIGPLSLMGATVLGSGDGHARAPLIIQGGGLRGITYDLPVASAQVKSAILIAGMSAEGETVVREPAPSRDHTERMLTAMGARLRVDEREITLQPGPITAVDITVPGDFSSAAFWITAACLHPDAELLILGVGVNQYRTGLLEVFKDMGADVTLENQRFVGGEPVADIRARSSHLRATSVGGQIIPALLDELPLIALAATQAVGTTEIRDAAELRIKESDRISATCAELTRLGARVEELPDGLIIHGGPDLQGASCSSHGDHRIALTLAVAGLVASGETVLDGAEDVSISYPEFWSDLDSLGETNMQTATGAS